MRILRLAAVVVVSVVIIAMLLMNYRDDVFQRRQMRQLLFDELQPIGVKNCELERFGEANDGGYLLCGNLLSSIAAGYSYGISGYDGWGCEISRRLSVPVHQYDCFDTRRTVCQGGDLTFHEECVAETTKTVDGRRFATVQDQIGRNGDRAKRLVIKMDVEGAEWESLASTAADVLDQIDQLAIEFHGTEDERFLHVVRRLKQSFYLVHLHFNNYSCQEGQAPFPSSAYEVLFVNRKLGEPDPSSRPVLSHRQDAPNNPRLPDCQRLTESFE